MGRDPGGAPLTGSGRQPAGPGRGKPAGPRSGKPAGPRIGEPVGQSDLAALLGGPVTEAARGLLGCLVCVGGVTVRLTEVEAYSGMGEDPASHAHRGPTSRNSVMFGPAGYAYVYFTYGMHWCVNITCGAEGEAAAVLLRAGEVVDGAETARRRRPAARSDRELARGPARLASALAIDGLANGTAVLDGTGPILLRPPAGPVAAASIRSGPRVGVTGAHDREWRFWLAGDPTVSGYRRHTSRPTIHGAG